MAVPAFATPSGAAAARALQLRSIDLSEQQQQKMMRDVTKMAIDNSGRVDSADHARERWGGFLYWMECRGSEQLKDTMHACARAPPQQELREQHYRHHHYSHYHQGRRGGSGGDVRNQQPSVPPLPSDIVYPFDVIIDGANVGYYKQNFAGAPKHINWEQLDWVVRHFKALGHRPLIILHQRHTFPNNLPQKFAYLPAQWREEKILYNTPAGANDDWYWLWAALYCQSRFNALAGQAGDPSVVPRIVLLISNDEMRDHHFRMPSKTVTVADVQAFSVSPSTVSS